MDQRAVPQRDAGAGLPMPPRRRVPGGPSTARTAIWRMAWRAFDVALCGRSMVCADERVLELTGPQFRGRYEYWRRATLLGWVPA